MSDTRRRVTVPHGLMSAGVAVRGFSVRRDGGEWRSEGQGCVIGSHESCDVVLGDPTVSRFHCEIQMTAEGAKLRDTGSRNGTMVGGVRVVEAFLDHGASIVVGQTELRFEATGESHLLPVSQRQRFGLMVAQSPSMRRIFSILERAAASDATVLLEGETGTGKSLAARSIHRESRRSDAPFVTLDCGAVPDNLLESELFGHEKGAFTGAEQSRAGVFEEAEGGTVFLDEIGELPLHLQPKLLGVLENRELRRLGSNQTRPVNVRLVAATNRDLRQASNEGSFRSDLYFRLAVVRVSMPALRERDGDIQVVADNLLAELGASAAQRAQLLNTAFVARLTRSTWPGNIRELKNFLERCLVLGDLAGDDSTEISESAASMTEQPFAEAKRRAVQHFEREYVTELLEKHNSVSAAAEQAEIDRTYLYRLMKRSGISVKS